MSIYQVTVSRTETRFHTFEIEAQDEEHACEQAYLQAYDFDYHNAAQGEGDYDVTGVTQIDGPRNLTS